MTKTEIANFISEIKSELKYLGESQNYIVKNLRIPEKRLICLIQSKAKWKEEEIIEIKTLLGI